MVMPQVRGRAGHVALCSRALEPATGGYQIQPNHLKTNSSKKHEISSLAEKEDNVVFLFYYFINGIKGGNLKMSWVQLP